MIGQSLKRHSAEAANGRAVGGVKRRLHQPVVDPLIDAFRQAPEAAGLA